MYTNESNRLVPVWNHRIALRRTDDDKACMYSDEVEISAGWKTPVIALWRRRFCKRRQRKRLKLLRG